MLCRQRDAIAPCGLRVGRCLVVLGLRGVLRGRHWRLAGRREPAYARPGVGWRPARHGRRTRESVDPVRVMNPILHAALGSIVRFALAALFGYVVKAGIWSASEAETYVGAGTLAVLGLG